MRLLVLAIACAAMIIKEGYTPPAMRYADTPLPRVTDWTVMIAIASATAVAKP